MTQETIFEEVKQERLRQDASHGSQPQNWKPTTWVTLLTEELGEISRAIIDGDKKYYRHELI